MRENRRPSGNSSEHPDIDPIGYFLFDREGLIIEANLIAADMLDTPHSSLIRQPFTRYLPSDSHEAFRAHLDRVYTTGHRQTCELNLGGKDHRELHVQLISIAMRDESGELSRCRTAAIDITGQKRAEEQLRKSKEHLAEAQHLAHVGSWEWDIAADKVTWSDELYRIFGLSPGEFGASYGAFLDSVHPDDRERVNSIVFKALRDHQPIDYYHRTLRPDGLVRILHCRGQVVADEKGNVIKMFGTAQDVTELKEVEESLRESEERFRLIVESVKDYAIYMLYPDGRIASWNAGAKRVTGYTSEEIIGRHFSCFYPQEERKKAEHMLKRAIANGSCTDEGWRTRKDQSPFWASEVITPLRSGSGTLRGFVIVTQDITQRKEMEETIRRQAYHDALTGLLNRILFIDHLDFAINQAHRSGKKLAVMFLDLDRFKTINDSLGHTFGDKLLIAVAHRLKASVREADMVARMGGDEYTILLSQVNHEEDIVTIVEKIIAAFKQPYSIDSRELHITVSIGISIYPNDGDDAGILMQNADTAMYHAKEEGRNNYQFYNPVMNVKAFRKIVLEHGLCHTLQQEELTVHYQPLVNIGTGKITGMEALVRWRHPDLGLLTPLQFIPLAEETGLITAIDEWVLRTACAQNKAWQNAGYAPLCVTVNLSAHHLQHTNLVKTVDEVLRDTSLDPRFLCIEITESTIMQNIEAAAYKLSALNELGVRCAIDDFGIGYSSLSYLKKLPIHKLKIDKSFISDLLIDTDNKAIVQAIIVLAHNLKMKVVAEGVEYEDQRSFLQAMRCDEMQGYLSGQPLPPEEFERLIAYSPDLGADERK